MTPRYRAARGTFDLVPPDADRWAQVEAAARELFFAYGYREIRTPILEPRGLFERSVGETTEIVQKQMYVFQDRGGDWLALRPEGTAPVIRAFLEHGLHLATPPHRYFYIGPMFRYERPQRGRFRQFHQIGVEVLGEPEPETDVEVLAMARALLTRLGVENVVLELNSIGDQQCRPEYLNALRAYFQAHREDLCADCQQRLERNPLRILDCKVAGCQAHARNAPRIDAFWCGPCRHHFEQVLTGLERLQLDYHRNPFLVRGLDYYVRTAFEFVVPGLGAQNAVLGGGRYDGLVAELGGPEWPGIGFAIGMERLMTQIPETVFRAWALDVVLLPLHQAARMACLEVAQQLRQRRLRVWVRTTSLRLKSGLRVVHKLGARFAILVGEDEIESGQWTVRDMEQGVQDAVAVERLGDWLIGKIRP